MFNTGSCSHCENAEDKHAPEELQFNTVQVTVLLSGLCVVVLPPATGGHFRRHFCLWGFPACEASELRGSCSSDLPVFLWGTPIQKLGLVPLFPLLWSLLVLLLTDTNYCGYFTNSPVQSVPLGLATWVFHANLWQGLQHTYCEKSLREWVCTPFRRKDKGGSSSPWQEGGEELEPVHFQKTTMIKQEVMGTRWNMSYSV